MWGQTANAEIYACNLTEAGGSLQIIASSHIPQPSRAWVWQTYNQSLNILFLSTHSKAFTSSCLVTPW